MRMSKTNLILLGLVGRHVDSFVFARMQGDLVFRCWCE
jgi:hypothetical protein